MFNSILVVCVGNICRSPMAEALLRDVLKDKGVTVSSAGIGALVGHPADKTAQELMRERGLDIGAHRARQLNAQLLREHDLVLVMEPWHQRDIEAMHPFARGKVHRLGKWGEFDVPDPYRKPREAFEQALAAIDTGIEEWKTRVFT